MRKSLLLALLLSSFFTVCTSASAEKKPTLRLGWSGPLTGNAAIVGQDSLESVKLAIQEANASGGVHGQQLELFIEDDGYNTVRALSAYQKLVQHDQVKVIIANTYSGIFATSRATMQDDVVIMDSLDCNEDIAALPANIFCLGTKTESVAAAFAGDIIKQSFKTVAIFSEEGDGWVQLIKDHSTLLLERAGVRVFASSFSPETTTFRASLLQARQQKAEALIILGNDQMGTAVREAQALDFKPQLYGIGSVLSPGFQKLAGPGLEGIYISSWLAQASPELTAYRKAFQASAGRAPYLELAAVPAYDASKILIECLRKSSQPDRPITSEGLRSCLLATKDYPGLSGKLSFDSDGAVRSLIEQLYVLRAGKLESLTQ